MIYSGKTNRIRMLLILSALLFAKAGAAQSDSVAFLNDLVASYLNLKNALVKDRADSASMAAGQIYTIIRNMPPDKISKKRYKTWVKYYDDLSYDAEHIKGTDEIDHQREHFMALSKNMYGVLKAFGGDETLYYQFCPMANKGKGAYWLSETEQIRNPYYGKKMYSCGSTKETISPSKGK